VWPPLVSRCQSTMIGASGVSAQRRWRPFSTSTKRSSITISGPHARRTLSPSRSAVGENQRAMRSACVSAAQTASAGAAISVETSTERVGTVSVIGMYRGV